LTFETRTPKKRRHICVLLKGWREQSSVVFMVILNCKNRLVNTRSTRCEVVQTFTPPFQESCQAGSQPAPSTPAALAGPRAGWRVVWVFRQGVNLLPKHRAPLLVTAPGAEQDGLALGCPARVGSRTAPRWELLRF